MTRISIICEGQTEQEFCNKVLQPHFNLIEIYLETPTIAKTRGGIVGWEALKYQIEKALKKDSTVFVTTLIDFYGIHAHHKYPNWEEATQQKDKNVGIDKIEKGMLDDLAPDLRGRFIPYIQLHEFEALLFSDIHVYNDCFEPNEFSDYNYLEETIAEYSNPEMINDGAETAPSKRLSKIIKGSYYKVVYGALITEAIGLVKIRHKCTRFNTWMDKLETLQKYF